MNRIEKDEYSIVNFKGSYMMINNENDDNDNDKFLRMICDNDEELHY